MDTQSPLIPGTTRVINPCVMALGDLVLGDGHGVGDSTSRHPHGEVELDGTPLFNCAIITTEPNSLLGLVHNRMPMILPQGDESLWLDAAVTDAAELLPLLTPYAEELEAYPVSRLVNAPANDAEECIEPAGERLRVGS